MTTSAPSFLLAFALTVAGMVVLAVSGGRAVSGAEDFSVAGRKSGSWSVAGAIMGTLVGGASTIGTAQLAFLYGLSAWWFTLGAGLACLFLGLFLAAPLRRGRVETIPQFISRYHGERARVAAALFSALGMFIHIVAQLLAAAAILSALFGFSLLPGAAAAAVLVALFASFGGMKGAGPLGLAKLLLLYLTMVSAGILALRLGGGWQGMRGAFPDFPWFSLFGYGVKEGVSDLFSMLVGVVSTQTYLQAVFSARDSRAARGGALISAALIPPLGLFGIAIGLFMRRSAPDLESALALPTFIMEHLPPAFAGIAFAALLIAAVGTASGLALGVGTTLKVDVFNRAGRDEGNGLARQRGLTVGVLVLAMLLLFFNLGSAIMEWSFLSMGLRGATLCFPLLAAVAFGEKTSRGGGALSIFLAPLCVIAAALAGWERLPPLYLGLLVSLLALLWGFWRERNRDQMP
jgi:SSS family solute:Na+ symporter